MILCFVCSKKGFCAVKDVNMYCAIHHYYKNADRILEESVSLSEMNAQMASLIFL